MNLGLGFDRMAQRRVAVETLAVREDADVLADRAVVVEDVAAHVRARGEHRRKRIADGSGVKIVEVNQLLKQFQQMQQMMKLMKGGGGKKLMRQMEAMRGRGGFPGM